MPVTHFRPYTAADRAACLAIFDSNVPGFFAPGERADFAAYLDMAGARYVVLCADDGKVVGCGGHGRRADGTTAILRWGMILRSYHRRGLGRQLTVARLEQVAADPTIARIVLYTTGQAAGFYQALGFHATAVLPDHYGPGLDQHTMARVVDAAFRDRLARERGWRMSAPSRVCG